jgi:hypothetical protein
MRNKRFKIAALVSLASICARAQAVEGKFTGMYVCGKLPMTRNILRAPIDLLIKGENVRFARPLFNLDGSHVVGTEMADGTINSDGQLHLTSEWSFLGNTAKGEYSGSLTNTGGTLTGTQTWTGAQGAAPVLRTCTVALVSATAIPGQR